ncbi:MAG: F-type H+-transporting ATPase subunit delta, partial [Bacteriovoracaceae bacterium]
AAKELTTLTEIINSSNNLENLLFLDVFTVEEKLAVLSEITSKLNLSPITNHFITFLVQEKRIGLLPLIFKEVVVIDDHKSGFLRGTIEGAGKDCTEEFKNKMKTYLKEKLGLTAELTYKQNSKISAGYKISVDDLQLDASLDNQLNRFKESVLNS